MHGIFTNICPKNFPNVGKYTIHGIYGNPTYWRVTLPTSRFQILRKNARILGSHWSHQHFQVTHGGQDNNVVAPQ